MVPISKLRKTKWTPNFTWQTDLAVVADMINLPHADYPNRVNDTLDILNLLKDFTSIDKLKTLFIHSKIMNDLDINNKGKWRNCQVWIGNHTPPNASLVNDFMAKLLPVEMFKNKKDAVKWYINFETVHPFIDGNGRVGGVILAILSRRVKKDGTIEYLTPDSELDRLLRIYSLTEIINSPYSSSPGLI